MEIFVPDRNIDSAFEVMRQLAQLGIAGRDAAYLASVHPYGSADPAVQAKLISEFHFIVEPTQRSAAAEAIGLADW